MTGNGAIKALNDKAALIRHILFAAGLVGGGTLAWSNLEHRVEAADDKATHNAEQLDALKGKINRLGVQQQVIITNQDNDRRNQMKFQAQTERALGRILDKLDRPPGGDPKDYR